MFNDIPMRIKGLFVSLIIAIFVCSMAFAYVFVIDGSAAGGPDALMYATIFAIVFIALNAVLLALAYVMLKRAKAHRANENTYLDPKGTKDREIRPKG